MIEVPATDMSGHVRRMIDDLEPRESARVQPSPHTGDHTVQFYLSDAHLAESVGRFVGAALAAGDAAVVVATADHVAAVDHYLAQHFADGFDVERARIDGRYLCLDAPTTLALLMRDGQLDPEKFKDVIGGVVTRALAAATSAKPRIAVYGELVALLSAEGHHDGALALERMWNELIASHPISLHCGYPLRSFSRIDDAEALQAICDTHTAVIPAESYPVTGDEEARRRATAMLQQRSEALDVESAERRRALAELKARDSELISALATRDQFLMAAAHELKTPVTSLRVYAQLLQRDLARKQEIEPDRLAVALQAIERQTTQLADLVSQLVDIAQIETKSFRMQLVACDLIELVDATLGGQPFTMTHHLEIDGPADAVDGMAIIDPERMGQVLTILAGNAAKFSPAGSTISFRIERLPATLRLSVTDQGTGVAPEQREHIFERFHQARGERYVGGMGLGLYVARQIVQLHGGTIRVEESEHPGARFVIDLPAPA